LRKRNVILLSVKLNAFNESFDLSALRDIMSITYFRTVGTCMSNCLRIFIILYFIYYF